MVHELPLHQIPPSEDRAIPAGSEPDHGGSAPPRPLDMSQLVEVLGNMQNMENRINGNMQNLGSRMDVNMQMLKAGQEEIKAELVKVRGEMQAMDWKMAPARGGMTESRGSVEVCRTAVETGEVEGTSDAALIKGENYKLGQDLEIVKEMRELKEGLTETQREIERVKDELNQVKEEHTHIELEGDIEVERVEC